MGLALAMLGCTSDEDRCETICEWGEECAEAIVECPASEIDECVREVEDLSDDCENAFEDFADCLDENDLDCEEVESDCQGEAAEFVEQCEGQFN